MEPKFEGFATIKVRFRCKIDYEKFRKYVLKTNWMYGDIYPSWEELIIKFYCVEDLEQVTKTIVMLLQLGFEVYSCQFKLEEQLAEEEHPTEEDLEEPEVYETEDMSNHFSMETFVKDLWNNLGRKRNTL